MELIDAVWKTVPDFREEYEMTSGLFRDKVPAYDEIVVRELVVNALCKSSTRACCRLE
jgi:ATP-dependent DNA helicase RecG